VKVILATASGIYDSLAFTHEAGHGSRTYLEWEATAFDGVTMSGIRVLTKNVDGKIARAAIHHRRQGALHMFSGELRRRLDGTVDSSYFHGGWPVLRPACDELGSVLAARQQRLGLAPARP
jgi:hypothetical protein